MSTWSSQSRLSIGQEAEKWKFRLFVVSFIGFAVVSLLSFSLLDMLAIRTYLLSLFFWLLVTSEIFAPDRGDEAWWSRLQWIKASGWIVVTYIIAERFLAVFI